MKLLPQRKKEAVADALTPDLADADHGSSQAEDQKRQTTAKNLPENLPR